MNRELKLKTMTPEMIAEATGGKLHIYGEKPKTITAVADSSYDAAEGSLFIAFKGARADGADYMEDAMKSGAVAALTQRIPEDFNSENKSFAVILVDDVVTALGKLAAWYRSFSSAKFIAVTGSVGKTSTKELISSVSSVKYRTHKTTGNHNNEIGLPLAMFDLTLFDEVSVVEMGMSALGEISYLTNIVKPDVAVITNIGTSHLANLGSRENICRAKMEIVEGLKKDGTLIINGDEPLLTAGIGGLNCTVKQVNVHNKTGDFRAMNIRAGADGSVFDMIYDGKAVTNVEVPVPGKHNIYNALLAFAVGAELHMTDVDIRRGIKSFTGAEKRQNVYDLGNITVIDDCYNASPESMRAAIDVLISLAKKRGKRPCALLGDMLELGTYSRLMHDQLGQYAAQSGIEKLYCYGPMCNVIAEAAVKKGIRIDNVAVFPNTDFPEKMAEMVFETLNGDEILLVKASNSIHADRVIEALKDLIVPPATKKRGRKSTKAE